jgi:transcriptional regulator with XRE-family HTH domain
MENNAKIEQLRSFLSTNIKARRDALNISQERLAELADVSVQTIKSIESHRTWVSDKMLINLADVLGVAAFQLLIPSSNETTSENYGLISSILKNLKQNIQDDINKRFNGLETSVKK